MWGFAERLCPRPFRLAPILLVLLGAAACSDYRDNGYDDDYPPPPGPDVEVFVSGGCYYYWDGGGYCYWDGYGYHPWVYGRVNYFYGPRGAIVVGGPAGCVGLHGVLPPPPGRFHPLPILRGGPRPPLPGGRAPLPGERGFRPGLDALPRRCAQHGFTATSVKAVAARHHDER